MKKKYAKRLKTSIENRKRTIQILKQHGAKTGLQFPGYTITLFCTIACLLFLISRRRVVLFRKYTQDMLACTFYSGIISSFNVC